MGLVALGLHDAQKDLYARVLLDGEAHVRGMMYVGLADVGQPWTAAMLTAGLSDSLDENVAINARGVAALSYRPAIPRADEPLGRC